MTNDYDGEWGEDAITNLGEAQWDDVDRAWNALVNDYNLDGAYV